MRNHLKLGALVGRAALTAGLLAAAAATASAETPVPVQGWQALIGCWEPVAKARDAAPDTSRGHLVCIIPGDATNAVEFVTIVDGKAVERERIDASGTRQPLTQEDCTGWQSAEWSSVGHRLFVRSELTCAGGLKRTSTGVISMPSMSEWVDVQSVAVGERKGVRTLRYREAHSYASVPAAEVAALGSRPFSASVGTARLAAATPVLPADVLDVARHLHPAATEMWLAEHELGFKADAGHLRTFAQAGVAASVIDMVVALSYPERFVVAAADVRQQPDSAFLRPTDRPYGMTGMGGGYYDPFWDPYYGTRFNRRYYSPYGYSRYGSYGGYGNFGYDNGWYPSTRPVVIIVSPSVDTPSPQQGRVVNGQGYTRRPADPASSSRGRSKPSTSTGSSGSSGSSGSGESSTGSSSSGGSSSGGSSSGGSSSGERTAKRRPPPSASN